MLLSNANSGTSAVVYDGTNTFGTSGTFTLSTTGMTPCGYTICCEAWDRALVSSSCTGHYNDMGVGFCLRAPILRAIASMESTWPAVSSRPPGAGHLRKRGMSHGGNVDGVLRPRS